MDTVVGDHLFKSEKLCFCWSTSCETPTKTTFLAVTSWCRTRLVPSTSTAEQDWVFPSRSLEHSSPPAVTSSSLPASPRRISIFFNINIINSSHFGVPNPHSWFSSMPLSDVINPIIHFLIGDSLHRPLLVHFWCPLGSAQAAYEATTGAAAYAEVATAHVALGKPEQRLW